MHKNRCVGKMLILNKIRVLLEFLTKFEYLIKSEKIWNFDLTSAIRQIFTVHEN